LEILNDDLDALTTQMDRIKAQATYKTGLGRSISKDDSKEGIRIDYSFYQHGAALYNGFYGAHYVTDMAFWIAMSEGLSFEFSEAQQVVLQDYVLDGHQWTNRYGVLDPNITNRKISQANYDYVTLRYHDPIVYGLEYLCSLSTPLPRATEMEAFYQHMVNGADSQIEGNHEFWKTDYMVQAGDGYQVSTKLWSYHNEGTEYMNGDGRQGRNLSLGGTFLLQDGGEYLELFPMWNWGHVPGTTTLNRDPASSPTGELGTQMFAGGISNGSEGGMVYDHDYDSVTAKKSWFYFDDAYVMLGAGINGGDGTYDVNTTVNQIFQDGDVTIQAGGVESTLTDGEVTPENLEWVYHDNAGYLFPSGGAVTIAAEEQSGSWYEINDSLSSTVLTEDVFSLWFDHGLSPVDDSYACVVVPAVSRAEFDSFREISPITILSNTSDLQAVRHSTLQLTQLAFHTAGDFVTPQGYEIEVSEPCLVMIDESTVPATVTVSDPTQVLSSLLVQLEEPDWDARSLYYVLPVDDEAGSSTQTFRIYDISSADAIDLSALSLTSYHTSQDNSGGATFSDDGLEMTLTGNTWKALGYLYTVTSDTILEFTVEGSDMGEMVGISLDEDLTVSNLPRLFTIGGTDTASDAAGWNYTPRYTAGDDALLYQIPVGSYFTGEINYIAFLADDDADSSTNVTFSNVKIYENSAEAIHYNLYVLAGESNASGRANYADNISDDDADDEVIYYYDTDTTGDDSDLLDSDGGFTTLGPTSNDVFGPEIGIGRTLVSFEESNPCIVKFSRGGTNLDEDWDPDALSGELLYSELLEHINTATSVLVNAGHTYTIKGLFWLQGESDGTQDRSEDYVANLEYLISSLRADLELEQLPVIIAKIGNTTSDSYQAIVQSAQISVAEADAYTDCVETDDLTYLADGLSYDAASTLTIGTRMAQGFLSLTDGYYSNWSETLDWGSVSEDLQGSEADPDGDGYTNAAERALGLNPIVSDATLGVNTEILADENDEVQFKVEYYKGAAEMSYQLLHAESLESSVDWSSDDVSSEAYDSESALYYRTWTAPSDLSSAFVRLFIE
jgi:chondroitin AC lyase